MVSFLPSNPGTTRKTEDGLPLEESWMRRGLSAPWWTTFIPGRSNGSNITDLSLASANVENFEEDSFRTSLKVALRAKSVPDSGTFCIANDWFEFANTKVDFSKSWKKETSWLL